MSCFREYEILIVDNGGSSGLRQAIEDSGLTTPWRLIQAPDNRGCANLNLLFALARGQVIVCLDDDSYPDPNCLGRAWELFEADPLLGMIGFKLHVPQTLQPWHDPWWNPNVDGARQTVFCPGCGLAFRNDPRLPDEICVPDIVSQAHELSMAAEILRLGYRVEFRPECVAFHPDTTEGYKGDKARVGNQNQLRFLIRYADVRSLAVLLFSQLLLAFFHRPNEARFAFGYLLSIRRRPLSRSVIRRFREVFSWHIHPKLGRFL